MSLNSPMANNVRPTTLDDVVGQSHLIGPTGILRNMITTKSLQNMIFYGPTGTGKTTTAKIIANQIGCDFEFLNAANIGTKEIKAVIDRSNKNKVILVLDEIHMFNKKQQQAIIDVMENGNITLIAMTAENPYFTINKAVLSRSIILEFKRVAPEDSLIRLEAVVDQLGYNDMVDNKYLRYLASECQGDMRSAMNKLELITNYVDSHNEPVTDDIMNQLVSTRKMSYDRDGDDHYDTLSAFHKSMRGSDVDASIHYLARLIKAGDIQGITRRILCVATEDVGLGDSMACVIANSCVQTALQLGFPEAKFPLAHAVTYLCLAPKSDSVNNAISKALYDLDTIHVGDIPPSMQDAHYKSAGKLGRGVGYKYPHEFPNHFVHQQYLPDPLVGVKYYDVQNNHNELRTNEYNHWLRTNTK